MRPATRVRNSIEKHLQKSPADTQAWAAYIASSNKYQNFRDHDHPMAHQVHRQLERMTRGIQELVLDFLQHELHTGGYGIPRLAPGPLGMFQTPERHEKQWTWNSGDQKLLLSSTFRPRHKAHQEHQICIRKLDCGTPIVGLSAYLTAIYGKFVPSEGLLHPKSSAIECLEILAYLSEVNRGQMYRLTHEHPGRSERRTPVHYSGETTETGLAVMHQLFGLQNDLQSTIGSHRRLVRPA